MALIGNMIAEAFAGNPATINYTMFVAAFSMFTLFYLVPASINIDWAIHPIFLIAIDTLNAILFLTAGIALAAKLECHSCSNDVRIVHDFRPYQSGKLSTKKSGEWSFRPANSPKDDALQYYNLRATLTCGYLL